MKIAAGFTQWLPLPYGRFGHMLRDPIHFHRRTLEQYGGIVRFRIGPTVAHLLYHPDHVRHVLFDNPKNYVRGWHYRLLSKLVGDNLVSSEGAYWLRQRRLAQPAFHRQRLAGYANVMVDATGQCLSRWGANTEVDVGPEMSRLALAIASRTLFDRDMSESADRVGQAFNIVARYLEMRFASPFSSLPAWVPTPANRRFKSAMRDLFELVLAQIRERRKENRDHGDLLSILMQARDEETGESMTDEQLRAEALTFLIAGHETTATALTWTWYLLATHPSVQQRLRDEANSVLGDRQATFHDTARLIATRMVIEESMRLYPPIWGLARQVVTQDAIAGFHIPRGSLILLLPVTTHRHPATWENPDEFDPDRFTPERSAARPKGAYFPFLGGPHQCIGNEFALLEMQLIVAMVVRQFELELATGPAIEPKCGLTLRPSTPVRVILKAARLAEVTNP